MVETRICTFCGSEIEPGTGRMYIKKDGVVFNFCTSKCFKNMVILGRVPRRTTWTRYYEREKEIRMKGLPVAEEAPKARKIRKSETPAKEKPTEKPTEQPAEEPSLSPKAEKPEGSVKKTVARKVRKVSEPAKGNKAEKSKPTTEKKPKPEPEGADK